MSQGPRRRPRTGQWRALAGGLATACAVALASCGGDDMTVEKVTEEPGLPRADKVLGCLEDEGYTADVRAVDADLRKEGATGALTVLLDLEAGSAVDNLVEVYYWDSQSDATRYADDVSAGRVALEHEQLGTVTITHIEHSHDEHSHDEHHAEDPLHHEVEAIAECVA